MVEEEFTINEVLDADGTRPPRKNLLDFVPLWIRHAFRRFFGWPHLSPYERWEMLVIIKDEFHKQLENHLLSEEALEAAGEAPPTGVWN